LLRRQLAVLAIVFIVAVLVAAAVLRVQGVLDFASPRAVYFLYLLALGGLVLLVQRWPKLAGAVLLLSIFEFTMGALGHLAGGSSLLPENFDTSGRFRWHALLQATPRPSIDVAMHDGKRLRHSAEGTRGRDRQAGELAGKGVIAVFGGSSTYDVGLGEGETWVDRLEQILGPTQFATINHGVPGHSTVEHLIQTAFYQVKFGTVPRCAVYYVGWNDIKSAHIQNLDPAYADFHLPGVVDVLRTRRVGGANIYFSPLLTMLARFASGHIDTVQYAPSVEGEIKAGSDPALEQLYQRNVRSISALNRERGIKTVWIAQLLNRAQLTGDGRYGWLPYVRDRDVWPLQARFNDLLRDTAQALGDNYIAPPIEAFEDGDFVDQGHFSAAGAAKFAARVAPTIREACGPR
jgi:lysophospholipase L1-like esterase